MKRMRIGHIYEIGIGEELVVNYEGESVIVRRSDSNEWLAYGRLCPHMAADLLGAQLKDGLIRCPGHGLLFDSQTGECISNQCSPLPSFAVIIERSEVFLSAKPSGADSITTFILARYGTDARIGRFELQDLLPPQYGQTIAVRTPRGVERAEVLPSTRAGSFEKTTGFASPTLQKHLRDSLDVDVSLLPFSSYIEAEIRKFDSHIIVLEIEVLLCGSLVVHLMGDGKRALGALATRATAKFGKEVSFELAEV